MFGTNPTEKKKDLTLRILTSSSNVRCPTLLGLERGEWVGFGKRRVGMYVRQNKIVGRDFCCTPIPNLIYYIFLEIFVSLSILSLTLWVLQYLIINLKFLMYSNSHSICSQLTHFLLPLLPIKLYKSFPVYSHPSRIKKKIQN